MVDVTDSKSVGLIPRVGSSPTTGTKGKSPHEGLFPLAGQIRQRRPVRALSDQESENKKNRLTNRGFFANITGRLDGSEYPGYAGVAQSVEQLICNQQVGGSSPSTSSNVGASDYNRIWGNSRVAKGDRL